MEHPTSDRKIDLTQSPSPHESLRRERRGREPAAPERAPQAQLPNAPQPTAMPLPPGTFLWRGPLTALRHPNFRLFYWGQLLSLTGTWMHSTAQGWLVLELTDSELMLGVVTAAGSIPILLFTLYAGVVADRVDKRRILIAAQGVALVCALALAMLTDFDLVRIHWILLLVFLLGTANAFEIPTRQSFFVELVGKRDLTNAIALNSSAFNLTRIVGPALAGIFIGSIGIEACFYVNAASYLAVIGGLLAIRRPPFRPPPRTASTFENLREGVRFIVGQRLPRTLVVLVAAASILALPYVMLLPVFARDILEVGASGLGWMLSATGAGALAGGLALAWLAGKARRGRLLVTSATFFSIFVVAFSVSRSIALSLPLLAGAGFALIPFTATVNALIQSLVPDELRGRVMSVYVFMFLGMTPLGSLQAGALASRIGAPMALSAGAVAMLGVVLTAWWRVPELREIR